MGSAKEILEKHKGKYAKKQKQEARLAKVIHDKKTAEQEVVARVVANDKAAVESTTAKIKAGGYSDKPGSRADLMNKAKAQGIKYFRIMTKEELFQVLDHPGDIVRIQEQAQARWKSGWGAKHARIKADIKKEAANVPA